MAEPNGFYLLHRGWQDNPVFRGEAFSRRDAFVWMIEEASFKDRKIAAPKGELTLARGQFCHSLRFMAKAWKWEESRVRRFLSSLRAAKIIDAATDAGQTLVTVCNYDKYQTDKKSAAAATDAASPQQRRGDAANEKEGNKGKKITSNDVIRASQLSEGFEPSDGNGAMAQIAGKWSGPEREAELARWRAHHTAKGTKMKDWDAAWQTWIGNSVKFQRQSSWSFGNAPANPDIPI